MSFHTAWARSGREHVQQYAMRGWALVGVLERRAVAVAVA